MKWGGGFVALESTVATINLTPLLLTVGSAGDLIKSFLGEKPLISTRQRRSVLNLICSLHVQLGARSHQLGSGAGGAGSQREGETGS